MPRPGSRGVADNGGPTSGFVLAPDCETGLFVFIPATNRRVPHISLVFREMWDTTNLDLLSPVKRKNSMVKRCGIPHLAKYKRDAPNFLYAATGQDHVCAFH